MMVDQRKWVEELGKFLLDVGKYVLTAVVISSFLGDKNDSWQWLLAASVVTIIPIVAGLLLIRTVNSKPKKKK